MKANVICCNDGIEFVVVDDAEKALEKMEELKKIHYELNKWSYGSLKEYERVCYWHIHTVDAI